MIVAGVIFILPLSESWQTIFSFGLVFVGLGVGLGFSWGEFDSQDRLDRISLVFLCLLLFCTPIDKMGISFWIAYFAGLFAGWSARFFAKQQSKKFMDEFSGVSKG